MSEVVVERGREPIEAPTHAEVTPPAPDPDAGLSELERHKKARGYGEPPKLPTPNAKGTKPSVNAAPEPKAKTPETPAAEATPEPAADSKPAEPALDAKDQIVDPDTHERYDGRTKAGKRVRQLLNDRAQLRDGLQALRTEVETLRRQVAEGSTGRAPQNPSQTPPQGQAQASSGDDPEPQLAQFQSYDEYSRATARWVARQELRSAREADRASGEQARQREQFQQQVSAFQEKTPAMQDKYPDYLEVIGRVPAGPQTQHIIRTILTSPVGPELNYFLGSHPEAMQALMQAPTLDAHLRLLGRYEHEVESALTSAPAKVTTSRAPAPVSPVATSGSGTVGGKKPGEMNYAEYRNARGFGPSFNRH